MSVRIILAFAAAKSLLLSLRLSRSRLGYVAVLAMFI